MKNGRREIMSTATRVLKLFAGSRWGVIGLFCNQLLVVVSSLFGLLCYLAWKVDYYHLRCILTVNTVVACYDAVKAQNGRS